MPDQQLPKGEMLMCRECDENDYDDDYEDDETDIDSRWSDFYSWLDQLFGYELAVFVNAPRGDSAEGDETETFLTQIVESWKDYFETNIDEDGVLDCKRRMSVREEDRINSEQATNGMTAHDVMVVAVDLGLYEYNPLDESVAHRSLITVGVALHDVLWSKASQCESYDYETGTL